MDLESRESQGSSDTNEVSRRDFLKKVGIGAAGLGAASMLPSASALDFESGNGFSFGNQTSTNFELGSSGDLNLQGGDIQNAGAANVDKLSVGGDGPAESFSEIGGSKGVADAVIKLEGGTPTAFDRGGGVFSQDPDFGVVMQDSINRLDKRYGGGRVTIASGTYPMNSQINVVPNLTIVGQGAGRTVVRAQSEAGWFTDGNVTQIKNLHFRDFTFDGNNQGGSTRMFFKPRAFRCSAHRMEILNCGDRGSSGTSSGGFAFFNGDFDATAGQNEIVDCYARNCAYVSFGMQKFQSYSRIDGCVVEDPNPVGSFTHPVTIESNDTSKITNCTIIGKGNPAINANSTKNCVVDSNTIKNATKGIHVANGATEQRSVVSNNAIKKTTNFGILVQSANANENLIIGNTLEDTGGTGIKFRNGAQSHIIGNVVINPGTNPDERDRAINAGSDHPKLIANNITKNSGTSLITGFDKSQYPSRRDKVIGNKFGSSIETFQDALVQNNVINGSSILGKSGSPQQIQNNYVEVDLRYPDVAGTVVENNKVDGIIENQSQNQVAPTNAVVRHNSGYVMENSGSASVSDGDTISHGLDLTPTYVNLTTSAQGHIASASSVGSSNITVELADEAGSAVTSAETVYWEAKAR